jgi:hypothetical protein
MYREMNSGEEQVVCDLVKQVFDEYVGPDYGQEGTDEFFRFANPNAIRARMQSGGFVLVSVRSGELVGMLEFYPPDVIAMLFVTVKRQGIATKLLSLAITKITKANNEIEKLAVHSSPYAVPIY